MSADLNYRIDPDYVVPDPSPAKLFGYSPLLETLEAFRLECDRNAAWMREAGATQFRVTIFRKGEGDVYPDGVWFEGWLDPKARQLAFGCSLEPGGVIYPPLVADASADLAQSTILGETA